MKAYNGYGMKLSHTQARRLTIIGGVVLGVLLIGWLIRALDTAAIDSYAACTAAGYPVQDTNPPVCVVDDRNYIGPVASDSPTAALTNQAFELLVDADSHGSYARDFKVITNQPQWQTFWGDIHASVSLPPLISVDFGTSDVVALSAGVKPTGGYKMEIVNLTTSAKGTAVHITETTPVNCIVTQSPTNPYYIIQTVKLPQPVNFIVTQAQHDCSAPK